MKKIIEGIVAEKKPRFKLRECLEDCELSILKLIYHSVQEENDLEKREEIIDYLCEKLPENFKKDIPILPYIEIKQLDHALKHGVSSAYNASLFTRGYLYLYKADGGVYVVVPTELLLIYKKEMTEELRDRARKDYIRDFTCFYCNVNGALPFYKLKELLEDTIEEKLSIDEIKSCDNLNDTGIVDENYVTLFRPTDMELAADLFIAKSKREYKVLGTDKLILFNKLTKELSKKIKSIVEKEKKVTSDEYTKLLIKIVSKHDSKRYLAIADFTTENKLSEDVRHKLSTLIESYQEYLYYWDLNGTTMHDENLKKYREECTLIERPSSFLDAVEKLTDEEVNLAEAIDDFRQRVKIYDDEILSTLLNAIEAEEDIFAPNQEIEVHTMFIYKEGEHYRLYVPDEIKQVIVDEMDFRKNNQSE